MQAKAGGPLRSPRLPRRASGLGLRTDAGDARSHPSQAGDRLIVNKPDPTASGVLRTLLAGTTFGLLFGGAFALRTGRIGPWLLAGLLMGNHLAFSGWIGELVFRDACAPALRRPDGWAASLLRLPIRLAAGGIGFALGAAAANGLRLVLRPFSPTRTFVGGAILNVLLQWILGLGKEKAPGGDTPPGAGSIPPVS